MRKTLWSVLAAALFVLLAFAPVAAASPSQDPSISTIPYVVAVTDGALCYASSCKITANVTYNTGVAISGNADPDFVIEDVTTRTPCTVDAVTTVPPPAGVGTTAGTTTLYLRTYCLVNAGDVMLVIYHETSSGYIYNAATPVSHAHTPQLIRFTQPAPVGS